jgi:hypothetical protein
MSADQFLVLGIVLFALSIPELLQAASESRFPRTGAFIALTGAILIAYATSQKAGGYSLPEIPGIFVKVIRNLIS